MPGGQLNCYFSTVGDFDGVGPPIRRLIGIGPLGHEFRKNRDLNVVSDDGVHGRKLCWQIARKPGRCYISTTKRKRKSAQLLQAVHLGYEREGTSPATMLRRTLQTLLHPEEVRVIGRRPSSPLHNRRT